MQTKVAVVIPVYKEELDEFEKISLAQARKVLGKYPFVFVAPEGKIFSYFESGDGIVYCPQQFFQSVKTYNRLLMSPQFYEPFLSFDYILLYQLDAFVFYDALEFFCGLGYDYIGAPVAYHSWYVVKAKKIPRVGNGGFSLRKVKTCHQLLKECVVQPDWNDYLEIFYEDTFLGRCGVDDKINFHTAPVEVAVRFAVDYLPDRFLRRIGNKIPFGCHGGPKYSADAYVKIFRRAGYDLTPLRPGMGNKEYNRALESALEIVAFRRLVRGIEHGQSVLQYLPMKKFSSVRIIRSTYVKDILAGMIQEDYSFTEKIFICDIENHQKLLEDLRREDLPHLVLTYRYDEFFIRLMEERGFVYGRDFISFRQEYLKHCEKIFHALGK